MATTAINDVNNPNNHATVDSNGDLHTSDGVGNTLLQEIANNTSSGGGGGSSGFSTLAPGYPTQIAVGTTSIQLFPINLSRKYAHVFNNSSQPIYLQFQSDAALNQGVRIGPGNYFTLSGGDLWLGAVNAIGLIANQFIDILEGE